MSLWVGISVKKWSLVLLASAAMTGCTSPGYVTEHPVQNQVPPLKEGVHSIQAVDVKPVATREVEPDYPSELESIIGGKATVVFTVLTNGKVADAAVVQADDTLFGEAALTAVRKWRFRPAEIKGAPVDCRMTLPFIFDSPYGGYLDGGMMPDTSHSAPPDGPLHTVVKPL